MKQNKMQIACLPNLLPLCEDLCNLGAGFSACTSILTTLLVLTLFRHNCVYVFMSNFVANNSSILTSVFSKHNLQSPLHAVRSNALHFTVCWYH